MKKYILLALLVIGIAVAPMSYGQEGPKAEKKESKMDKKEAKGKM